MSYEGLNQFRETVPWAWDSAVIDWYRNLTSAVVLEISTVFDIRYQLGYVVRVNSKPALEKRHVTISKMPKLPVVYEMTCHMYVHQP